MSNNNPKPLPAHLQEYAIKSFDDFVQRLQMLADESHPQRSFLVYLCKQHYKKNFFNFSPAQILMVYDHPSFSADKNLAYQLLKNQLEQKKEIHLELLNKMLDDKDIKEAQKNSLINALTDKLLLEINPRQLGLNTQLSKLAIDAQFKHHVNKGRMVADELLHDYLEANKQSQDSIKGSLCKYIFNLNKYENIGQLSMLTKKDKSLLFSIFGQKTSPCEKFIDYFMESMPNSVMHYQQHIPRDKLYQFLQGREHLLVNYARSDRYSSVDDVLTRKVLAACVNHFVQHPHLKEFITFFSRLKKPFHDEVCARMNMDEFLSHRTSIDLSDKFKKVGMHNNSFHDNLVSKEIEVNFLQYILLTTRQENQADISQFINQHWDLFNQPVVEKANLLTTQKPVMDFVYENSQYNVLFKNLTQSIELFDDRQHVIFASILMKTVLTQKIEDNPWIVSSAKNIPRDKFSIYRDSLYFLKKKLKVVQNEEFINMLLLDSALEQKDESHKTRRHKL